ncbi:MAG: hypothetical protein WCO91_02465 [Gemmataceae bacterium]|nr:hypothetical protein [Planctomycetota bacterium]RLT17204.1 MAG: hypothetical protein DWI28_06590 [Planctomycetota bacterium]
MANKWTKLGMNIGLWALCLVMIWGCSNHKDYLKPPPQPEEFRSPPTEEARFSRPVEYPKELLNEDALAKKATKTPIGALKSSKGGSGAPGGMSN